MVRRVILEVPRVLHRLEQPHHGTGEVKPVPITLALHGEFARIGEARKLLRCFPRFFLDNSSTGENGA
jgi:hypothetical protein